MKVQFLSTLIQRFVLELNDIFFGVYFIVEELIS